MNRTKVVMTTSGLLVLALGTSCAAEAATEAVQNPHTEPRQREETPQMTNELAYTTTSSAVLTFGWLGSDLESVSGPAFRVVKKR
jgi:hypothetical protein